VKNAFATNASEPFNLHAGGKTNGNRSDLT
jgi:hypothetical protein